MHDDDATAAMINRIRNAMFRTTGFSTTRWRPGYVPADVDALVSEITGFSAIRSRTDDSA